MIKLEGVLINTFHLNGGKNQKGEEYEARDKIQLLGSLELPNGELKNELVTLTVEDSRLYSDFMNRKVSVDCGAMALGRSVVFYVRKGSKPVLSEAL